MADDVLIVGGGVVGAACAYFLRRAGAEVTIIDRSEFGKGCSHGNCGYVSPSHILPLCQPGAIGNTLKSMLSGSSPLYVKPRLDWQLWSWLWRFAGRCNRASMLDAGRARQSLLDSSRQLYGELIDSCELTECDWHTIGLLFVYLSQSHFDHYGETNELLEKEFGLGAKRLANPELQQLEPALKPNVAGAWLYECDAHLRPDRLMAAWKRALEEQGVTIKERVDWTGLEQSGGRVTALNTSVGNLSADQYVIATGAWSPQMAKQLGCTIPIQPGKGYSITMERPEVCPKYPMIFEEHRVAVTPLSDAYRIGSTMEFAGYDTSLNRRRLDMLTAGATHYLHTPVSNSPRVEWYGWRPMSCDGKPIIGRVPKLSNVCLATGHSMLGVSMAPATGKLVTEIIGGQLPHVDPHPLRVDRF
ncbi:MAG: FAD-dependent oxidoreductase [Planctomycetaceae bacterium]|nr:FAD-dependent oxidoreductase [Planctomycetaceae bacterium]